MPYNSSRFRCATALPQNSTSNNNKSLRIARANEARAVEPSGRCEKPSKIEKIAINYYFIEAYKIYRRRPHCFALLRTESKWKSELNIRSESQQTFVFRVWIFHSPKINALSCVALWRFVISLLGDQPATNGFNGEAAYTHIALGSGHKYGKIHAKSTMNLTETNSNDWSTNIGTIQRHMLIAIRATDKEQTKWNIIIRGKCICWVPRLPVDACDRAARA